MHFYQVIIGSEILNRRREDRHFEFLSRELLKRGERLYAVFIAGDERSLLENIFTLVKNDSHSIMFCFGGIGSTPDDLTREVAAKIFTGKPLHLHEEAKKLIVRQFKDEAYPYRIRMADLPEGADLLHNPINEVPGFSIEKRYFFVPGFPQMAHPMVLDALDRLLPEKKRFYQKSFTALASENDLIEMMQKIPKDIELSSLPAFCGDRRIAVISLVSRNRESVDKWYEEFKSFMQNRKIKWVEGDRHDDPGICDHKS